MHSPPGSEVVLSDFTHDDDPESVVRFLARWVTGDEAAAREHLVDHRSSAATTLTARLRGAVVGLVTLRWSPRDPSLAARHIPLLHQLAVASAARRTGVATVLMDAIEELAIRRGRTAIGVTVGLFDTYGPAQRLYARRGYLPDGSGACRGRTPLRQGDTVRLDHDVMLWLIKDLDQRVTSASG